MHTSNHWLGHQCATAGRQHRGTPSAAGRYGWPGWTTLLVCCFLGAGCGHGGGATGAGQSSDVYAHLELENGFPEAFGYLSAVREMMDGRVLGADPLSRVVLRLDLATGHADTLGHEGGGPQEYMQPDQVFALPGDSTLLVDLGKARLIVIDPDGVFEDGGSMAVTGEDGRPDVLRPGAVDRHGRIYFKRGFSDQDPPDSTTLLRYDRATRATETIGRIWKPVPVVTQSGATTRSTTPMMAGRDDWAVGPDGDLAIVRVADYSVEWHHADGRVVTGPSNPVEPLRISDDDKRTYLEQRQSAGLTITTFTSSDGGTRVSMSRGNRVSAGGEPDITHYPWADEFAPFRPDRSMVSPRGELWVERWLPAHRGTLMDVFDSDGTKLGTVDLPEAGQLIGFGSTAGGEPAAYLVRADSLDLKWLERYRILYRE